MSMRSLSVALLALALWSAALPAAEPLPIKVYRLDNGLTLVVSEDHSTPVFGLSVVYGVGFRLEPRGRTGFAHLFEHMMFEGTPRAPKGVFDRVVEGGGGSLNGSTRYDYTNYISKAPVSALAPLLWLEADRMRHLDFSQANLDNQRKVVKEEIRVNVKNRPYGLFFWTDLAALAFDKWENAHDGYGSFEDLDRASLDDVKRFHDTFYVPNNAVIGVSGDVDPDEVHRLVKEYFGDIPMGKVPPRPDVSEPLNDAERHKVESDPLAKVPALAVGWKVPGPHSPDWWSLAVLGALLMDGEAGLLYQKMVKEEKSMLSLQGGLGWPLGDPLTMGGPTLLVAFGLYKPNATAGQNIDRIQAVIDRIARDGPDPQRLEAVKTRLAANFYRDMSRHLSRANYLAIAQRLHGDAGLVNRYIDLIRAVTPDQVRRAANRYLTVSNRSWIDRRPAEQEPKS